MADYIISVENFSKKYLNNNFYSIKDATFKVPRGVILGLIGHNGAGKSTLLKAMVGINHFTEGDIKINGYSIKKNPVHAKNSFAYVGDREEIEVNLTARQYFRFIGSVYNADKKQLEAKIKELSDYFKFSRYLDQAIKTYSLGTRQKLSLIKAFLSNRDLIILDEPLNGLDPAMAFALKQYIKKMQQENKTIIFSSHYIKVVSNICDEIIVIKRGKILDYSKTSDILKKFASLEDYYLSLTND